MTDRKRTRRAFTKDQIWRGNEIAWLFETCYPGPVRSVASYDQYHCWNCGKSLEDAKVIHTPSVVIV